MHQRFLAAVRDMMLMEIPTFSYLGMFAGPTKPKPFERKRANLTALKQGKMLPLSRMRQFAMERHRGSERPLPGDASKRETLALDHIHGGLVSFPVFSCNGPQGLSSTACQNARLVLGEEHVHFMNDESEIGSAVSVTTTKRTSIAFVEIRAWSIGDTASDVTKNGLVLS